MVSYLKNHRVGIQTEKPLNFPFLLSLALISTKQHTQEKAEFSELSERAPWLPICSRDSFRQSAAEQSDGGSGYLEHSPVPDEDGSSPYKLPELRWDLPQAAKSRDSHSPHQASECRGRRGLEKGKVNAV